MSLIVAPLTTTVMNALGAEASGLASGVNNAVSRVAALLAIALFGLLMSWAFDAMPAKSLDAAGVPHEVAAFVQGQCRAAATALTTRWWHSAGSHRDAAVGETGQSARVG